MNNMTRDIINVISNPSRAFKIVNGVSLLILFITFISLTQPMVQHVGQQPAVMVRALLDTSLFFVITYFFIRTYLKLNFVNDPLSGKRVLQLLAYLLLVSILGTVVSFLFGKIAMLQFTDISSMQFTNEVGQVELNIPLPVILALAVFNTYFTLVSWAVIYIFTVQQMNRKKQQQEMHQAQIQQLTNQLNPHFLFNAFNSIRALIYEDQDKAADTVTLLSELFRTHLKAHLSVKSSLADELQVSSNYLAIEKIRLEDRLLLNIDVDLQLNSQTLPTLTLLTLVENAIKHGISPNKEPGTIAVNAFVIDQRRWGLTVSNTFSASSIAAGTKTGLKNVRQRLQLTFGTKCKWQQTQQDGVYSVQMELPRD